jgi:ABC-type methionine transport system ATPase subunit
MPGQIVRLIYKPEMVEVPVLNQLIRRFDITVNIISAQVSAEGGWLEVQVSGSDSVLEEAIAWLHELGIQTQTSM